MKRIALFLIVLFMASYGVVSAGTTFDTTPSWDGSSFISPYGFDATSTYGQTFIAPSSNILQDFTFYINVPNPGTVSSTAYVFAWSGGLLGGQGGQATGPALFTSPSSIVLSGPSSGFQAVTVNTGGVTLTPGGQYVMLLTDSNPADFSATTGNALWGDTGFSVHVPNDGGGGFAYYNNGNDPSLLNTSVWDNGFDFGDLAFKADFTGGAVPEPSTLLLLGSSLVGLVAFRKKFRA